MTYYFRNVLGTFIIDNNFNSLTKVDKVDQKLQEVPENKLFKVLELFKDKKFYQEFYEKNLELTKKGIKDSVNEDNLIVQTIANINELDKTCNLLTKRLREWYSWYLPELSQNISNHERFAELVVEKSRDTLLKEIKVEETMGADLDKPDVEEMLLLAKQINELYVLRDKHEDYLRKVMKKYCPNFLELAGTTIGAKLLELGKSLRHLALLPSSTIQLLGAEKALFRHIKTGAKSPKYGVIINHPIVQDAKKDEKGKAARVLADKLSLCARLDFFKGEFKAPEYKKELERRFGK